MLVIDAHVRGLEHLIFTSNCPRNGQTGEPLDKASSQRHRTALVSPVSSSSSSSYPLDLEASKCGVLPGLLQQACFTVINVATSPAACLPEAIWGIATVNLRCRQEVPVVMSRTRCRKSLAELCGTSTSRACLTGIVSNIFRIHHRTNLHGSESSVPCQLGIDVAIDHQLRATP